MQDTVMRIAKELFPREAICIGCDQWRHTNKEDIKNTIKFTLFDGEVLTHQIHANTWEEILINIMDIYEGVENGN